MEIIVLTLLTVIASFIAGIAIIIYIIVPLRKPGIFLLLCVVYGLLFRDRIIRQVLLFSGYFEGGSTWQAEASGR